MTESEKYMTEALAEAEKALAAGGYYTYENALKNAAEILGEIKDE